MVINDLKCIVCLKIVWLTNLIRSFLFSGFYFWLSIFAVVLAAPVNNNSTMDCCKEKKNITITEYILAKLKTPTKWEDPCGNTVVHNTDIQNTDSQNIDSQAESVIIPQLIDGIIIVTRNALIHAAMFRERFVSNKIYVLRRFLSFSWRILAICALSLSYSFWCGLELHIYQRF